MDKDIERMKVEIAADYVTTAFTDSLVILVTIFLTVFASAFSALLAKQVDAYISVGITWVVEIPVIISMNRQRQNFDRRTDYLDTLIETLQNNPTASLGSLRSILDEARKQ